MLELIVLGEVPGTSFQITFSQILIVMATMLIASELRIVARRKLQDTTEEQLEA